MRITLFVDWARHASRVAFAIGLTAFSGCSEHSKKPVLSVEQSVVITNGVRAFAADVARDVTKRGPLAWLDHFEGSPAFFMAIDGRLAFPDGAAAARGVKELPRTIASIELHWQHPIRVDPLTPSLAMVATGWNETTVDPAGHKMEQGGYFTGLVELGPTGWKFRDVHWSVATSPSSGK